MSHRCPFPQRRLHACFSTLPLLIPTVFLPFGMDLESMPSLNVSGSDENQMRNQLRNQLITELVEQGKSLEPGSARIFDASIVEVELRRKNSVKEIKSDLKFAFKFI